MGDSQDVRFMGGLSVCMPFTSSCLVVSNFALCGVPFLPGFFSKDFILEMVSNIAVYFKPKCCVGVYKVGAQGHRV